MFSLPSSTPVMALAVSPVYGHYFTFTPTKEYGEFMQKVLLKKSPMEEALTRAVIGAGAGALLSLPFVLTYRRAESILPIFAVGGAIAGGASTLIK